LTSKIINMAERIKDAEDRMLESLFASEPIADDGFGAAVLRRIRRRLWVRRLTLPVATLIGAAISFKPLANLVSMLAGLVALVRVDVSGPVRDAIPHLPMLVLGAMLLATFLVGLRTIED